MEEITDLEDSEKLFGEPIEVSAVEVLVDKKDTAESVSGDEDFDIQMADETDVSEEDADSEKYTKWIPKREIDDLEQSIGVGQVDTGDKLGEYNQDVETTQKTKTKFKLEDVGKQIDEYDETLRKESDDMYEETDEIIREESDNTYDDDIDETLRRESDDVVNFELTTQRPLILEDDDKDSMDYYDVAPRFTDEFDDGLFKPTGDFTIGDGKATVIKFFKYMKPYSTNIAEGQEEEEEEEKPTVETALITRIDRAPYYARHIMLTTSIENEKFENNLLQFKMGRYFKRKKLGYVLKESTNANKVDTQAKYDKILDAYVELLEIDSRQRETISEEIRNLEKTQKSKLNKLKKRFNDLQAREKQVGTGLINFNTGKPIPDKVVERLIRLQKYEMEKVNDMRLKFIKLNYLLVEKEEVIAGIDQIGEDLFLMDFEQLKTVNRHLADKIEERDEELTKFRMKCQNTIQILAHVREKTSALEADIEKLKLDLTIVGTVYLQVRENLNSIKQERDYYRSMINELQRDSGLLTETDLLRDMEVSMVELQLLTEILDNTMSDSKIRTEQIRSIRKAIEVAEVKVKKKSLKYVPEKTTTNLIPKVRPSIFQPTLAKNEFEYLKYFKPKTSLGKNNTKFNNRI